MEGAQNRLHRFLSNPRLTKIFGQQECVLSPERIIDEKKVLLVNLRPSIHIDEESNRLLGVLLVNEFYRVSLLRPHEPFHRPHPFFCYIDEFYHYLSPDIAHGLDGLRKLYSFLRLAHQHLAQLSAEDEVLEKSVLTNCRTKMVFGGLTPDDADLFARQLFTDGDVLTRSSTRIPIPPSGLKKCRISPAPTAKGKARAHNNRLLPPPATPIPTPEAAAPPRRESRDQNHRQKLSVGL